MTLRCRDRLIQFPRRPLVMAIVNINDDSFCGDGTLDPSSALAQAEAALRNGADGIDVGGESARTNRAPIREADEARRLRPFLERWPDLIGKFKEAPWDAEQIWPPLLSINTWRPSVAAEVLPRGGDWLNDIGGLPDDANARLCARHGVALVIMHSVGEPKVPHTHVTYPDVMGTLMAFFENRLRVARAAGLEPGQIILDPGIDFAKQKDDNLTIYRRLGELHGFDRPILLPVSRKTVIGDVLGLPNPNDRDAGTVACIVAGMLRGAQIFRVHQVRAAAQAVKVLWAVNGEGVRPPDAVRRPSN